MFKKIKLVTRILVLILSLSIGSSINGFWPTEWIAYKFYQFRLPVETRILDSKRNAIKGYRLPNGFRIVLLPDPQASKVLVGTIWNVGSANETDKSRGIAHLLEHMFFKGTEKDLSEPDVRRAGQFYGAEFNAFTDKDTTFYYFEVDKDYYKPFLEILADCSQNLRCDQQMLYSEFQVVVNELKMRLDNPEIFAHDTIYKNLFGQNHPYSHSVIGYVQDLVDVDQKSLLEFYKKHYTMDNGILLVLGNFDCQEVLRDISKSFGQFKKPLEKHEELVLPNHSKKTITAQSVYHRNVCEPKVYLSWVIPGFCDSKKAIIGDLCLQIICDRFNKNILTKHPDLFKLVKVNTYPGSKHSILSINFSCSKENIDKCSKIVHLEMSSIIENGAETNELIIAKILLNKAIVQNIPNKQNSMSLFGLALSLGKKILSQPQSIKTYFDSVKAVDGIYLSDINSFFAQHLTFDYCAQTVILPLDESSRADFLKEYADFQEATTQLLETRVRTIPVEDPKLILKSKSDELTVPKFPRPTKIFTLKNGLQVISVDRKTSSEARCTLTSLDFEWIKHSMAGSVFYSIANTLLLDNYNKKTNHEGFINNSADAEFSNMHISLKTQVDNFNAPFKHLCGLIKNRGAKSEDVKRFASSVANNFESFTKNVALMADRTRANLLYKGTDFCWTFEQAKELCQNLTLEQIENAWKEFFVPQKLVLILVGNLPSGWEALVEKELGSLKDERVEKKDFAIPQICCVKGLEEKISLPTNQNALLFVRANQLAANDFKRFALAFINSIALSGAQGSAIFKIREAKGLFYNAGGQLGSSFNQSHSFDFISASLAAENVKPFKKELWNMMEEFALNGVDESALFIAKKNVLKEFETVFAQDASLATSLLSMKINNLEPDFYDRAMEYLKNLSLQEFNQIVKEYCTDEGWATIEVGKIGQ